MPPRWWWRHDHRSDVGVQRPIDDVRQGGDNRVAGDNRIQNRSERRGGNRADGVLGNCSTRRRIIALWELASVWRTWRSALENVAL
jgi:hypothetical protein